MDIRPSFQLQTVIKAMTDVIIPAVDPNNKLAQEQAARHCNIKFDCPAYAADLSLREGRAGTLPRISRSTSQTRQGLPRHGGGAALRYQTQWMLDQMLLHRARADPKELEAANFAVREKIGHLITTVYSQMDPVQLKPINALVLAHAKGQLVQRSWLIAQGWGAIIVQFPRWRPCLATWNDGCNLFAKTRRDRPL